MSTPLWICKARFSSEVIQNLLWSFMLHARASIYFTFNYLYRFLYLCCGFVLFQLFSVVAVLCSFIFSISVYGLSLYFIIVCIFLRIKMVIWSIGLPSGYRSAFTNNSCSKIRSVHVIYPIWSDLIWSDLTWTVLDRQRTIPSDVTLALDDLSPVPALLPSTFYLNWFLGKISIL